MKHDQCMIKRITSEKEKQENEQHAKRKHSEAMF